MGGEAPGAAALEQAVERAARFDGRRRLDRRSRQAQGQVGILLGLRRARVRACLVGTAAADDPARHRAGRVGSPARASRC